MDSFQPPAGSTNVRVAGEWQGFNLATAPTLWTLHAQDCVFTDYLPNIDHTVWDADAQLVSDTLWWIDTFDLDGLRIDAVKHVPEAATRNLAAAIRETYEAAGTRYFLMGETAMGWADCAGRAAP